MEGAAGGCGRTCVTCLACRPDGSVQCQNFSWAHSGMPSTTSPCACCCSSCCCIMVAVVVVLLLLLLLGLSTEADVSVSPPLAATATIPLRRSPRRRRCCCSCGTDEDARGRAQAGAPSQAAAEQARLADRAPREGRSSTWQATAVLRCSSARHERGGAEWCPSINAMSKSYSRMPAQIALQAQGTKPQLRACPQRLPRVPRNQV